MTIQNLYPNIDPTLLLDFANVKALDPRITFARASAATYYGTDTAKAEENLFLQSQALATSPWGQLRITRTNNAATAPDGTTTATRVTQASGQTIFGNVGQSVTTEANSTVSVFAKPDGKNFIVIQTTSSPVRRTWFDVDNGTVGTSNADHTASIVDAGNGWYRCIVTAASGTAAGLAFYIADADNSQNVVDSGSVLFWGAQIEQRSTATNYTPTTTQPITNFIPVLESAASGEARFDHNPNTFESLGLLIEEQRTNLLLQSENFSTTWSMIGTASIVPDTVIAPTGTLTADKFVLGNTITSNSAAVNQSATKPAVSAPYTASVYIKEGEFNSLRLILRDAANVSNSVQAFFNASTGVIAQAASAAGTFTAASATITPGGNGWYRCSVTGTTSTETSLNVRIFNYQNGTGLATGNGFSGIFLWGASIEQGAFPTSYVKTTTAQVTRAADSASMTGANFSSWYRQDEGTIFCSSQALSPAADVTLFCIDDGTTGQANQNDTRVNSGTQYRCRTRSGNVTQADLNPGAFALGNLNALVYAYQVNNFSMSLNGATVVTDTVGTLPLGTMARLRFSARGTGVTAGQNYVRKLAFYPKALTAAELQGLTT